MSYPAKKIVMVRPAKFGFNPQTAESNAFQVEVALTDEEIHAKALQEFDSMAEKIRGLGIEVVVLDDSVEPYTPDSVFPNNWFSTHFDGTLCLYPMEAEARRNERNPDAIELIKREYSSNKTIDLTHYEDQQMFLEGTGSLVLDHESKIAYASLSSRTHPDLVKEWAAKTGFEVVEFRSFDENRKAIYHTNVMMCVGDRFAVICLESVVDEGEKKLVKDSLIKGGKEIVDISFDQMNSFAGNMILLQNSSEEKILVMSETARQSLQHAQISSLEKHAIIVSFDIEIIEKCGGGSVRCMIAEIF